MWKARVFTLYPEIFPGPLSKGLFGKAFQIKIWDLEVIDIRDSAEDKHKTVDDTPFGGGSGMLLKPNVLGKSLDSRLKKDERVFYLSPKGKKFDQKFAKDLRLLPGVLGNEKSKDDETFENGLLEYPQYTKPQIWEKKSVPEVLLSGDHAKIKDWRLSQSKDITRRQRPDLWEKYLNNKKNEKY